MQTTIRAKVQNHSIEVQGQSLDVILDKMAAQLSKAKRSIFGDLSSKLRSVNEIKKDAQIKFGITARQFNSIRYELQGVIESDREIKKLRLEKVKRRIKSKKEQLESTRNPFKRHHLKRKTVSLNQQLEELESSLLKPSICFGGRSLFYQQFHLEENGFESHEEWKKEWEKARNSSFFLVGSKDERFGNQSCQFLPQRLQVRLTHTLAEELGQTTIDIPIQFTYRQELIVGALATGQAMHYRFVREARGWYVHLTVNMEKIKQVSHRKYGALGIDLNPACIAVTHIGPDGNLVRSWQVALDLKGRRSEQVKGILGEEISKLSSYAAEHQIPIVIESLDFEKKKEELRSRRMNRMLSNFSYSLFSILMHSQCYRKGIELIDVNPAYTSVIGKAKFSEGYGLSTHMAAAMAIARRGLDFSELLRTKAQKHSELPARNRSRHVWSDWRKLSRRAKMGRDSASCRRRPECARGDRRSSSSTPCNGPPLHGSARPH